MSSRKRMVRPIERQCMRDWLLEQLDGKMFPEMNWMNRNEGIFRIKWCHGSRHGWTMKETKVFEAWAKHTDRDKRDHKRWKANFRCAIKSLKDVVEIKEQTQTKGLNAFRVFKMNGTLVKKTDQKNQTLNAKRRKTIDTDEDSGYEQDDFDCSDSVISALSPESNHEPMSVDRNAHAVSEPLTAFSAIHLYTQQRDALESVAQGPLLTSSSTTTYKTLSKSTTSVTPVIQATPVTPPKSTFSNFPSPSLTPNIPHFDKINPSLMEFGKFQRNQYHHTAFRVERGEPAKQLPGPSIILPKSYANIVPLSEMQFNSELLSTSSDLLSSSPGLLSGNVDLLQCNSKQVSSALLTWSTAAAAISSNTIGSGNHVTCPDTPESGDSQDTTYNSDSGDIQDQQTVQIIFQEDDVPCGHEVILESVMTSSGLTPFMPSVGDFPSPMDTGLVVLPLTPP